MLARVFALCVALAVTVAAFDLSQADTDLEANERLWAATDIESYEFVARFSCFGPELRRRKVRFVVRDGESLAVVGDDGKDLSENATILAVGRTVPELFARIRKFEGENLPKLIVAYSEELGYPKRLVVDFSSTERDSEFGMQITAFRRAGMFMFSDEPLDELSQELLRRPGG